MKTVWTKWDKYLDWQLANRLPAPTPRSWENRVCALPCKAVFANRSTGCAEMRAQPNLRNP